MARRRKKAGTHIVWRIGGAYADPGRRTDLATLAWDHLEKKAKAGRTSASHLADLEHRLGVAVAWFGAETDPGSIVPDAVRGWADALAEGVRRRPGTVRHYLNALSGLFRRAQEGLFVEPGYNPVAMMQEKPTGRWKGEAAFLEMADAARVLEAARVVERRDRANATPGLHAIIGTFLLTGGRRSEVLGLDVGDVNLLRGLVHFRPNAHRGLNRSLRNGGTPRARGFRWSGEERRRVVAALRRGGVTLHHRRNPRAPILMTDMTLDGRGLGRHGPVLVVGAPPSSYGYASSRRLEPGAVALPTRGAPILQRPVMTQTSVRTVPLHPQLREILEGWISGGCRPHRAGLLFPARHGGMVRDLRKSLDAIGALCGMKPGALRTRSFRHTYCSARLQTVQRIVRPGCDPARDPDPYEWVEVSRFQVQKEMGHGGAQLVDRIYGHAHRAPYRSEVVEYRVERLGGEEA